MKKKVFIIFLQNLPSIATIVIAVYSVSTGTIAKGTEFSWILVLLALFATTAIIDKFTYMEKISNIHRILKDSLNKRVSAKKFFQKGINGFKENLESADQIDICGVTLNRTVREYSDIIEKKLNKGAHVRIMFIDTSTIAAQHASAKSRITDLPTYLNKVETTIGFLKEIYNQKKGGTLEAKGIPFDPSFGITMINRDSPKGVLVCEIYQHISTDPSPAFYVDSSDQYWFEFFRDQFEKIWDKSNPIDLSQ